MSEYLVTYKQHDGRMVTEWVESASGDEAVESLRLRGYTDIVLHTDEVSAITPPLDKLEDFLKPRDYLALRRLGGYLGYVFFLISRFYRESWKISLAALMILIVRRGFGCPWETFDWVIFVILIMPLIFAVAAPLLGPSRQCKQLMEAVSWGRWEEVLQRLPDLIGSIPPLEAAIRGAQALAGLGRLEEGLRVCEPFAHDSQTPGWVYWSRLADVFQVARDQEMALAALEKAAELAPENNVVLLDLALLLLRYRQDTHRAKTLIDRARSHQLSDIMVPLLAMIEGIHALEEGHAHKAVDRLKESLSGLRPYYGASPLVGSFLAQIHTYLALAHAACGNKAAAVRNFRLAEPRLLALKEEDLLSRCQQAVGDLKRERS